MGGARMQGKIAPACRAGQLRHILACNTPFINRQGRAVVVQFEI
jgi:hypothetical protein